MSLVLPSQGALIAPDPSFADLVPAGAMMPFGGAAAPDGWLLCDGASVLVADYPRLHDAIGYAWGGAGANFNLPDMIGRMPIGVGTLSPDTYALADTGGASSHVLVEAELAAHAHAVGTLVNANQDTSHTHAFGTLAMGNQSASHAHTDGTLGTGNQSASHTHSDTPSADQDASHLHALTSQSTGSVDHVHSGGSGTLAQAISGGGGSGFGAIGVQSVNHGHNVATGNQSASHTHVVSGTTANQNASHSHTMSGATANQGANHQHTISGSAASTGSSTAHENRPAYAAVNYLIKA